MQPNIPTAQALGQLLDAATDDDIVAALHAHLGGPRLDDVLSRLNRIAAFETCGDGEADRLDPADRAALTGPPTVAAEVAGLQAAMTAAAEQADLPGRFQVVPAPDAGPGQPGQAIRDRLTGRQVPVPLFAYRTVREVLATLLPAPAPRWKTEHLGCGEFRVTSPEGVVFEVTASWEPTQSPIPEDGVKIHRITSEGRTLFTAKRGFLAPVDSEVTSGVEYELVEMADRGWA